VRAAGSAGRAGRDRYGPGVTTGEPRRRAPRLQVPPNSDLTLGMVCTEKSTPGRTVWSVTADGRFTNPGGVVQGGFLGAFADSAMGASAVTWVGERRVVVANAEMKISFLAPVFPGDQLSCTAEVIAGGSRVAFVEATITGPKGMVARATSTYLYREREAAP
jgi:uncharacterized protein (TIGR00369 family)